MHQPCLRVFPPLFPALGKKFLGVRNIADGGIEPYIQHLAFCAFYRNGNAPVKVTSNGTGEESAVQPALALAVNVGFPLLVLFQNPVTEPGLVFVKRQIPVLGLFLHGRSAAEAGLWLQKFFGGEGRTALFALVSVCMRIAAFGADALDEAVCKEHFGLLVIELLGFLDDEIVLVV